MDPAPAISFRVPATSFSNKSTARLEALIGLTAAAAGAALGAAMAQKFEHGAVSAQIRSLGGETIAALLKLYFLTAAEVNFDRAARERGVEILMESDVPLETAKFWVDEILKILKKAVGDRLN